MSQRAAMKLSGPYDGSEPAARWLKRLDYDLQPVGDSRAENPNPLEWIRTFEMLLTGNAATWSEQDEEVRELTEKKHPEWRDVETLKDLIQREFPVAKAASVPPIDAQLLALRQGPNEELKEYYNRTLRLLEKSGARNVSNDNSHATKLEKFVLSIFTRAWTIGLKDADIRGSCIPNLSKDSLSLASAFRCAVEATQNSRH